MELGCLAILSCAICDAYLYPDSCKRICPFNGVNARCGSEHQHTGT